MSRAVTYRPLGGSRRGLAGISRVYLADDHLLAVDTLFARERYRRVAFRDIQAIRVRDTRWSAMVTGALVVALLLFSLVTALLSDIGRIVAAVPTAIMAVLLVVHLALGPSCSVSIRTPVQWLPLPSLSRWRRADRALAVLRGLIVAAQGRLAPATLTEHWEAIEALPPAPSGRATSGVELRREPRPRESGRWHAGLAALLLVDAVLSLLRWRELGGSAIGLWAIGAGLVALGLALVATIHQSRRTTAQGLAIWGWVCLGYLFFMLSMRTGFALPVFFDETEKEVATSLSAFLDLARMVFSALLALAWVAVVPRRELAPVGARHPGP